MKLKALAIVALLLAPPTIASAQQTPSPGDAAKRVYNWCMRSSSGSVAECSCVAGFYAGVTAPDEFQMIAAVVDFIAPDGSVPDTDGMLAALKTSKTNLNLTDARYDELIQRFSTFGEIGTKGDGICVPLKEHAAAQAQ